MPDLHPEILALIEAGPQFVPVKPSAISGNYETPEEFARRIALRAVELDREELMKLAGDWMLSVENCDDAIRWHKAGGPGNAVSGAMNKLRQAIRRRWKP